MKAKKIVNQMNEIAYKMLKDDMSDSEFFQLMRSYRELTIKLDSLNIEYTVNVFNMVTLH